MKNKFKLSETAFQLDGRMPLSQAIPLGLQHVLAMFVGNLTPLLIITDWSVVNLLIFSFHCFRTQCSSRELSP